MDKLLLLLATSIFIPNSLAKVPSSTLPPTKENRLSWFPAIGSADNCTVVPSDVVKGPLGDSICQGAMPGANLCACVSTVSSPDSGSQTYLEYMLMCGTCFDPCALHFHVEHSDVSIYEAAAGF